MRKWYQIRDHGTKMLKRLFTRVDLMQDKRGVAAVEFAVALPLMLGVYFASAEVTKKIFATRKVTIVTRTLADLLSQTPQNATSTQDSTVNLDNTSLNTIFSAANPVLYPFASDSIKITLSSITFNPKSAAGGNDYNNLVATVDWSATTTSVGQPNVLRPCGQTALSPIADSDDPSLTGVPQDLYLVQGSIIVADVSYVYTSPFNVNVQFWQSLDPTVFKRAIFNAPRNLPKITYKNINPVQATTYAMVCPPPTGP